MSRWCNGQATHEAMVRIADEYGLSSEGRKLLLEKVGFFSDAAHLIHAFTDSDRQDLFIKAAKATFGMTDADFGLGDSVLREQRNLAVTPTCRTLVMQFIAIENRAQAIDDDMKQGWPVYKQICSRFLGHGKEGHRANIFNKQMDKEYVAQKAAVPSSPGEGHTVCARRSTGRNLAVTPDSHSL